MIVCQPVAPSGTGGGDRLGLGLAGVVRRPDLEPVLARRGVPAPGPLPPGVHRRAPRRASASCHGPSSTRTSTFGDAAVLRPGHAGDGRPARRSAAAPAAGVSMRDWVLIGACGGPAARDPVRVEVGERGQLELGEPLAWPTRSRTGRAPPSGPGSRARSAAARRSCRRPACASRPSRSDVGRGAGGEAVDGAARRPGRRRRPGSASSSRSASGTPSQRALPIRSPPTSLDTQASVTYRSIIGRASRSSKVSVIGVAHPAVDPQRPAVRVDLRHHQRGVDPVEAAVRGDVRREAGQAGRASAGTAGAGRPARAASTAGRGRRRPAAAPTATATATPSAPAADRRATAAADPAADRRPDGRRRRPSAPTGRRRPPAPRPVAAIRPVRRRAVTGRSAERSARQPEHHGADAGADQRRQRAAGRRRTGSARRPRRPAPNAADAGQPDASRAGRQHPERRAAKRQQHDRADLQGELVVRAEERRSRTACSGSGTASMTTPPTATSGRGPRAGHDRDQFGRRRGRPRRRRRRRAPRTAADPPVRVIAPQSASRAVDPGHPIRPTASAVPVNDR